MTNEEAASTALRGRALLADPGLNKGTAFTDSERRGYGLLGLLPDSVETIEQQLVRTRAEFDRLHDDLERHVYLRALQDHNEVLFYRFIRSDLHATLPIVYTPTVGVATQQFSRIYRRSQGLFLSYRNRASLAEQFEAIDHDVDVVVVTDGERILGLGDQGVGGIAIPNGKLALYSAFGGIDPRRTLPIVLDVGTNNPERLNDPNYLGWRHERIVGQDYDDYVDEFVTALSARFPQVLLQWEDFAQHNATRLMDRYRDQLLSFNDDIEGTAAVALAAIWSAVKGTNREIQDQNFCIVGAGSAGTGIARMLATALTDAGVDAPLQQIFLVDRAGLIHDGRSDLKPHQVDVAHPADHTAWSDDDLTLAEVVAASRTTVLVGVSGAPGLFTADVVTAMLSATDRPIVMPMSNPNSKAEATPFDILTWTTGQAVVATGSPFDDVELDGTIHRISQSNNVYVFPGLGLGAVAVAASKITPTMLMTAAKAVFAAEAGGVSDGVLPPLEVVPEMSRRVARAVARCARDEGLTRDLTDEEIDALIEARAWEPRYQELGADNA